MPAKSKKQQELMAIAEHSPGKVSKKNKGVLAMSKKQLSEFAKTKTSNLPSVADKEQQKQIKDIIKD